MIGLFIRAVVAMVIAGSFVVATATPRVENGQLVTSEGLTLYTFDNDVVGSGKSVCNGACAGVFPPYVADARDAAEQPMSLVLRDDGSKQWAHRGRPLYRFYADEKAGEAGGDGLNRNLWHIARP